MSTPNIMTEPVETVDLQSGRPLRGRPTSQEKQRIGQEIVQLRQQLGLVAAVTRHNGRSTRLEEVFRIVQRQKGFDNSLPGITSLDYRLVTRLFHRNVDELRDTLYALWRLRIAQKTVEDLRAAGIDVSLAQTLALYRQEGELDIPLTFESLRHGLLPDPASQAADWPINVFLGRYRTFFVEGATATTEHAKFVEGIRALITSHRDILDHYPAMKHEGFHALDWLECGKEGAMTMYLMRLAGLDMYTWNVFTPQTGFSLPQQVFRYHYARNRCFIEPNLNFNRVRDKGDAVYQDITRVDEASFKSGQVGATSIAAAVYNKQGRTLHHFLPVEPVGFVSAILQEGIVTLEGLRRRPLINRIERSMMPGSPDIFDPPLPAAVAYIRYNSGDVNFLLIVLHLLRAVLTGKTVRSAIAEERQQVATLQKELQMFLQPAHSGVWHVLDTWFGDPSYFLKQERVHTQFAHREAVFMDAQHVPTDPIGPEEKKHIGELNTLGRMDSAEPLLQTMTAGKLWSVFEDVMVAHIGTGGKPWLSHPLDNFRSDVGRNVLRFYYMLRGYEAGFLGTDIPGRR